MPKKSGRRESEVKGSSRTSHELLPWHARKPVWYERTNDGAQESDPDGWRDKWKEKIWSAAAPAGHSLPTISSSVSLHSDISQEDMYRQEGETRVQLPSVGILRHGNTPRTRVSEWPAADAELRMSQRDMSSSRRDYISLGTSRSSASNKSSIPSQRNSTTISSELRFLESRSMYVEQLIQDEDAENSEKDQKSPRGPTSQEMIVNLRNFGIGNTAISAFLRWMKKGNCKRGDSIMVEMVELLRCEDCTISTFDLSQNMIGSQIGVKKTMLMFQARPLQLRHLRHGIEAFLWRYTTCHEPTMLKQLQNLLHLDLSQNKIGNMGALNMAYSLGKACGLRSLDLSWNNIHGNSEGGKSLAGCLQNNRNLTYLNLSCNPWRDAGLMNIAEAIKCNGDIALKELRLANTKTTSVGCILFSSSVIGNTKLQKLNVNGNPIGILVRVCLLRSCLSRTLQPALVMCDISVSSVEEVIPNGSKDQEVNKYISKIVKNLPEGSYTLDLSNPTELAIAVELVELARLLSDQLKVEPSTVLIKLRRLASKTSQRAEQDPWTINPWRNIPWPSYDDDPFIFPMNGIFQCEFRIPSINMMGIADRPMVEMEQMFLHSLGCDDDAGRWRSGVWDVTSKTSSPRYKHFKDAEDDNDKSTYSNSSQKLKLMLSGMIDGTRLFSVNEVLTMTKQFDSRSDHLDIVVHAFPFIKDTSSISILLQNFSTREISRMQSLLGELFWYNPKRPMRRWKLNLSNHLERTLCKRLQDLCAYERETRKSEAKPDTSSLSEHGDYELWRNVRRPKLGSKAMKQQDFEIHCAEFRYFFEELLERREIKLEFLFATSALRPILQKVLMFKLSADQAVELCLCVQGRQLPLMSTYTSMSELMEEEDEMLDETASQKLQLQAQARAEIMQRAFPAIIDLDNLWGCMCRKLTLQDCIEISSRIGILNVWNPLQPEGHVELHLDKWDEHKVAEVVMDIALKEHQEEKKQGKNVDAGKLVKNTGVWSFAYQVEEELVRKDIRMQHAIQHFLIGEVMSSRGET
ncbi:hypothetical protein GUITHDRAFT_142605 [Guillardia theta CCMP2712]|uniref:DUF4476 domain-containing protein n=1 Tax=Guillardia theta (strain CCMP2712) TaxID=905079 RepID=L1IWU5_GUITC|nr:hypothetical protein GUITHDRAFT_142605 [Guillardia theta CCMP2712]EKX40743.1 hypothetical protein GUITHDRAFT_142605 [Guillardia theta CCMP2712]|eukprot:XP_005827723.1 hypothetical protein GUITHDRAFT_142605 [Guillardia theta CCMP2712]